jgi:MHS family citrate/tricarballylate:H+ symporter-like MFS transporter
MAPRAGSGPAALGRLTGIWFEPVTGLKLAGGCIVDDQAPRPRATKAQLAGVTLGNALEFYDFLVFSFFAVQIGQAFFPSGSPQTSLLSALATFGAGFLTRPLGALVIGGLGDRLGRRPMLLVSFALIGLSTLGVAVTPSYASIGLAAPVMVILCRLVQGFALGGEVGASSAFLAEVAPPGRRGAYVSLQFVGHGLSMLAAGLIGVGLSAVMDDATLVKWGWRIAMAVGVAVVPIGLALRRTLPETMHAAVSAEPAPRFATYRGVMLFAFLTMLSGTIATYVLGYMTTYAKTVLRLPSGVSFGATVAVGVAYTLGSVIAGVGSDRLGRRPLMIWPMALATACIMPGFWLLSRLPGAATLYSVSFVLRLLLSMAAATAFVTLTEALPLRVRSGAIAVVYAVATSVFGGSTQFVVAWLTGVTGDPLAPAWYMLVAALLGLVAMVRVRETSPTHADHDQEPNPDLTATFSARL